MICVLHVTGWLKSCFFPRFMNLDLMITLFEISVNTSLISTRHLVYIHLSTVGDGRCIFRTWKSGDLKIIMNRITDEHRRFYSPIQPLQTMSGKQALCDHDFLFHCTHETSHPLFTSDTQYLGGRFQLDRSSSRSTSRRRLLAIFYWWCVRFDRESTGLTARSWHATTPGRADGKYQIAPPSRWWERELCRRLTTRLQKVELFVATTQ